MEHNAYFKNEVEINAIITQSYTKKNIPRECYFAITILHPTHSINKRAEKSWLWISSTWNWEENKSIIVYGWLETAN